MSYGLQNQCFSDEPVFGAIRAPQSRMTARRMSYGDEELECQTEMDMCYEQEDDDDFYDGNAMVENNLMQQRLANLKLEKFEQLEATKEYMETFYYDT